MNTAQVIANLLRTPVYMGAKGVELGIGLLTFSRNFTFGQFVDGAHYLADTSKTGLEVFTEAAVKGSNQYMRALPFSEAALAIYEYLAGIDAVQLYTQILKHGDIDALKMLLARGVTKNHILLNDILRTEWTEPARYLIKNGFADIKEVNFHKVLCYVATDPTAEMTKLALENGADINFMCSDNMKPLEKAVQQNSFVNVVALVENGAEIPANILIRFASYDRHLESGIISYLVSQGVDPHYQDNNSTIFSHSVAWGEYKLANCMLDNYRVNVNTEHSGWPPLRNAIATCANPYEHKYCSLDLIRKIVDHGADVRYTKFGINTFEMLLQMSSKLQENVSDIAETMLCNGNFSQQEVNQYLTQKMSTEVQEVLISYIENDGRFCLDRKTEVNIEKNYEANDAALPLDSALIYFNKSTAEFSDY